MSELYNRSLALQHFTVFMSELYNRSLAVFSRYTDKIQQRYTSQFDSRVRQQ